MSLYVLPAVISLCVKAFCIIAIINKRPAKSDTFLGLVLIFALHNVTEILLFIHFYSFTNAGFIMRLYYCVCFWVLAYISCYVIEVSKLKIMNKFKNCFFIYAAIMNIVIIFTDQVIAGYISIGYALTALKGSSYWLFRLSAFSSFVFIVIVLIIGHKTAREHKTQTQCAYVLFALSPILLSTALVILLMELNIKVNAMTILPIASTLFLIILVIKEIKHNHLNLKDFVPPENHQNILSKRKSKL